MHCNRRGYTICYAIGWNGQVAVAISALSHHCVLLEERTLPMFYVTDLKDDFGGLRGTCWLIKAEHPSWQEDWRLWSHAHLECGGENLGLAVSTSTWQWHFTEVSNKTGKALIITGSLAGKLLMKSLFISKMECHNSRTSELHALKCPHIWKQKAVSRSLTN